MKVLCPDCQLPIPPGRIKVRQGKATCPVCEKVVDLSSLVGRQAVSPDFNIHTPPRGGSFEESAQGWCIIASTRSKYVIALIFFLILWSGVSLTSIYGGQIWNGRFSILLSLFGIPFLIGTVILFLLVLMMLFGHLKITVQGSEGRLSYCLGALSWTRRFDWASVTGIEDEVIDDGESSSRYITLAGPKRFRFGGHLQDDTRQYLIQALRMMRTRM